MNSKQLKAIALMVEGNLNQKQIAEELNVSVQSIIAWKKKPEFKGVT
ncbi:phBC6A51 family helix-turn-helix protein [Staphylococcus epidermidis]